MQESPHRHPGRSAGVPSASVRVVSILVIAVSVTFALVFLVEPSLRAHQSPAAQALSALKGATPFPARGIEEPLTVPAALVKLTDEEEVIGFSVGGKARAYLLSAFDGPQAHVVNDHLAGRAISVTHCDRTNCTRVFTGGADQKTLRISCAGWDEGLLLSAPGGIYAQNGVRPLMEGTPAFPYPELPFARTSWGEWRRAHPGTDVYLGEESEATALKKGPGTPSAAQND